MTTFKQLFDAPKTISAAKVRKLSHAGHTGIEVTLACPSIVGADQLAKAVAVGFGSAASVRTRRPGKLFQVELPSFLADGDGVQLYIEPKRDGMLRVSDVGHSLMRISYTRDIDESIIERVASVSERNGFSLVDGVISARVKISELIPALFGLAQVQAIAEATAQSVVPRGPRADEFRAIVVEALAELFGEKLRTNVQPPGVSEPSFAIDAIVDTARPLAFAVVANDVDAERAVGNRFRAKGLNVRDWVAIPRNINALTARSRARLIDSFSIAHSVYERDAVAERVLELAI